MWYELLIILILTAAAFVLGKYVASSRRRAEGCCLLSIAAVFSIGLLHLLHLCTLFSGLDFIALSRIKFMILAPAVTFGMAASLGTLGNPWKRGGILAALIGFLYLFIGLPFLVPAAIQDQTRTLPLLMDERGFCIQSRAYTCGPAAAVSALRRLGVDSREGHIALDSRTAPVLGTSMWDLYRAVEDICEQENLDCSYRRMADLDQIPPGAVCLTSVRSGFLISHCVTILKIDETTVTFVDPAVGLRCISRPHFEDLWYHTAIILQAPPTPGPQTASL